MSRLQRWWIEWGSVWWERAQARPFFLLLEIVGYVVIVRWLLFGGSHRWYLW